MSVSVSVSVECEHATQRAGPGRGDSPDNTDHQVVFL